MESSDRLTTFTSAPKDAPLQIRTTPTIEHQHSIQPRTWIQAWTPTALMVAYLVFSISLYTILDDSATKVFWFLFLTIATLQSAVTAIESYDGLSPLREARKAIREANEAGSKFGAHKVELPLVHVIFDSPASGFFESAEVLASIDYPTEKLAVTFLQSSPAVQQEPAIDYVSDDRPSRVRVMTLPDSRASSLIARLAHCLNSDVLNSDASITAIFAKDDCPHPQAIRRAVERLHQNAKLDVVSGRNILVPTSEHFGLSTMASLLQDLLSALLQPGSAIFWDLKRALDTTVVWRTEVLRAVADTGVSVSEDGFDLAWSSVARQCQADIDLRVISYTRGGKTAADIWGRAVKDAREGVLATVRYSGLAFAGLWRRRQAKDQKLDLKARVGILYSLLVKRLTSHTVLQYFCLTFSMLITDTPHSSSDLARKIYFQYPISEWFIIFGLLCLLATATMLHKARSESVSLHTIPIFILVYPLLVLLQAGVEVFGHLDAIVAAPR